MTFKDNSTLYQKCLLSNTGFKKRFMHCIKKFILCISSLIEVSCHITAMTENNSSHCKSPQLSVIKMLPIEVA